MFDLQTSSNQISISSASAYHILTYSNSTAVLSPQLVPTSCGDKTAVEFN